MNKDTKESEKRTDWAEDRTVLANERTFSGWMGTGLGAIGVAIAMKAVFGAFEPTWAAKLVASMFLAAAILIFWSARNQACNARKKLTEQTISKELGSMAAPKLWEMSDGSVKEV